MAKILLKDREFDKNGENCEKSFENEKDFSPSTGIEPLLPERGYNLAILIEFRRAFL